MGQASRKFCQNFLLFCLIKSSPSFQTWLRYHLLQELQDGPRPSQAPSLGSLSLSPIPPASPQAVFTLGWPRHRPSPARDQQTSSVQVCWKNDYSNGQTVPAYDHPRPPCQRSGLCSPRQELAITGRKCHIPGIRQRVNPFELGLSLSVSQGEASGESRPADTLISHFRSQSCKNKFLMFKTSGLWYCVLNKKYIM